ncbi:hypothetical protein P3342_004135 [Pyrenophora teres f. teres]|nr:hypothetical protein P3342_004135 [Pyrenophora teres f. teres]
MKYALIFATTAAAYDAYGGGYGSGSGGYGAPKNSTTPTAKPSTSNTSTKPAGYTTITPGYGKPNVTVTTMNQPYPTCVSAGGYGGSDCAQWGEKPYVSTTIKDYDNHNCTITDAAQPVIVYHTKSTITHEATPTSTQSGSYPTATGPAGKDNTGCWYELYEKIVEVPYNKLGSHALPGYPGSGLCKSCDTTQPVHVKECKGGKCTEYDEEYVYGAPKPDVTTYSTTGVYTVSGAKTTMSGTDVYTYPAQTVTVTKPGQAVTCTYEQTKTHQATPTPYQGGGYPAKPNAAEKHGSNVTPKQPEGQNGYPASPAQSPPAAAHGNSYGSPQQPKGQNEHSPSPAAGHGDSHGSQQPKGQNEYPSSPAGTSPAHENGYGNTTPAGTSPAHENGYGNTTPSTPKHPENGQSNYPSYPTSPEHAQSSSIGHYLYPSCADRSELQCPQSIIVDSVHHLDLSSCNLRLQHYLYPSCADCSELQCPQPIIIDALLDFHLQHCHSYPDQNYKPEQQHPRSIVVNSLFFVVAPTSTSTSAQATSTPCTTSAASTPTPVQATQVYPPKATSTPCDETKPSATSAAPPNPSSDNSEPAQNYGKTEQGYTKRGGLIQRRKPIIAKSKRAILL